MNLLICRFHQDPESNGPPVNMSHSRSCLAHTGGQLSASPSAFDQFLNATLSQQNCSTPEAFQTLGTRSGDLPGSTRGWRGRFWRLCVGGDHERRGVRHWLGCFSTGWSTFQFTLFPRRVKAKAGMTTNTCWSCASFEKTSPCFQGERDTVITHFSDRVHPIHEKVTKTFEHNVKVRKVVVGVTHRLPKEATPYDYFSLFLPEKVWEHTNKYAE